MEIQSIWHEASLYSREQARSWCVENGFLVDTYRSREDDGQITHHIHAQFDPSEAKSGSWAVIADDFPEGISASVCERGKSMDVLYTKGQQSAGDPYEFVMSDETVDRMGDVIVAKGWDLDDFQKNPIALFGHSHQNIIGKWENVQVSGKKLVGRLRMAREGTSELVNTVRSLVEQRILKSVSVGFMPQEMEPMLDKDGRHTGGYRFIKSVLSECSLVAVPCNPNALATAKGMGVNREILKSVFTDFDTGQSSAPIDFEARSRKTGIALAKLNQSLNHIEAHQNEYC